jgi:hypothetical protein
VRCPLARAADAERRTPDRAQRPTRTSTQLGCPRRPCGLELAPYRAGLEDDGEVADLGRRQFHAVAEDVQRRAHRADERRRHGACAIAAAHAVADRHRIVLAHHLAKLPEAAKRAAIAWRDQELGKTKALGIVEFADLQRSNNTSGVPGVVFLTPARQP